jgi:thiol-disulfide isomerase/thioredoxin
MITFLRLLLFTFFTTLVAISSVSQVKDIKQDTLAKRAEQKLKGLKKAELSNFDLGKRFSLNPLTTAMYFENLESIQVEDFMTVMKSGDYVPELYVDSIKTIKAVVFRKANSLEKVRWNWKEAQTVDSVQRKSGLVGKQALPFSVEDILGNSYSLDELKGKVVVLNFWFVECKPCIMEMPELNQLVDKYKDKEVVFLAFATNKKSEIEKFLKRKPFKYNIVAESKVIANAYSVSSYPTHVVIDSNSNISYVTSGYGTTTTKDLDKAIESCLSKTN